MDERPMTDSELRDDAAFLTKSLPHQTTPSEAVYAFAGWLTSRKDEITMSGHHNAAPVADLVAAFCKSQEFAPPVDDYPKYLKPYPAD